MMKAFGCFTFFQGKATPGIDIKEVDKGSFIFLGDGKNRGGKASLKLDRKRPPVIVDGKIYRAFAVEIPNAGKNGRMGKSYILSAPDFEKVSKCREEIRERFKSQILVRVNTASEDRSSTEPGMWDQIWGLNEEEGGNSTIVRSIRHARTVREDGSTYVDAVIRMHDGDIVFIQPEGSDGENLMILINNTGSLSCMTRDVFVKTQLSRVKCPIQLLEAEQRKSAGNKPEERSGAVEFYNTITTRELRTETVQ